MDDVRPGAVTPGRTFVAVDQLTLTAVSSTTNDVCADESSVPVNVTVTVLPMNAFRLTVFCAYPLLLLAFEYDARVVEPAVTVSLSYAVLPVSAVSMCSQYDRLADVHVLGIVTVWLSESVCVRPYPSSHAFQEPEWAASPDELSTTPLLAVHGAAPPVSKPGLTSS